MASHGGPKYDVPELDGGDPVLDIVEPDTNVGEPGSLRCADRGPLQRRGNAWCQVRHRVSHAPPEIRGDHGRNDVAPRRRFRHR